MRRIVFGVLGAVMLVTSLSPAVHAQFMPNPAAFPYDRYPPIRHNVPLYRQDTMVWCWVAAAKMVADYYRLGVPSQCEMLRRQYGAPCCENPTLCARVGHISEIQALIANFGGRISSVGSPANGFVFYDALRRGPIVLHILPGHFIVAKGMRVVPTPMGPLGVVAVNDPFRGEYEIEFPRLMQVWDAALVVQGGR